MHALTGTRVASWSSTTPSGPPRRRRAGLWRASRALLRQLRRSSRPAHARGPGSCGWWKPWPSSRSRSPCAGRSGPSVRAGDV